MKHLLLFTFLLFFLNRCIFNTDDDKQPVTDEITRIHILEREHGYSNFPTTVITTADSLNNFLNQLLPQSAWNYKQVFLDSITQAQIDFDSENLILFRQTETSGSNQLTIKTPYLLNGIITIEIEHYIPGVGTDDMAYYCFAYRVKKEFKTIKFKIEKMEDVIINLPEN